MIQRRSHTISSIRRAAFGRRSAAATLLAVVPTLLAVAVLAGPVRVRAASAQNTDAASTGSQIEIDAGFGGYSSPGRSYPVRVTISSDTLFEGQVRVSDANSGLMAFVRDIDIPGGTTRELVVVMESSPWDSGAVRVELVDGSDVVAQSTKRLIADGGVDLVGVLPDAAVGDVPEKVTLGYDAGEARLVPLDPALLGHGWSALGPLDEVAATAGDLAALPDESVDALLAWVNHGGRLLVDESTSTTIAGFPAALQAAGQPSRPNGAGTVVYTSGAIAAGAWESVLEPSPTTSRYEDEAFADAVGQFWGGEQLSWGLGRDAGVSLPGTGTLVTIVVAYVLLAGPIAWLVLHRMRRPGLAWLVVPVLAFGFTVGIWGLGSSFRDSARHAHGTVIEVAPRGSTATTWTLLNSRNAGSQHLTLPQGWTSVSSFTEGSPAVLAVDDTVDGTEVGVDLDAGGYAMVGGTGAAPTMDGTVVVTAVSTEDGTITGTVTNTLGVDLREVAVFADQAGVNIGTVAAGATVDYEMSARPANPMNGEPAEFTIWRDAISPEYTGDFGRTYEPGPVSLGLWTELGQRWSANSRPVGSAMVAGWTDELASPLDPTVTAGRTLVIARAPIGSEGGIATDVGIPRAIVRGSGELGSDFRITNGWGGGAMVRFVVPDGVSIDDLVLQAPRSQERIDVWLDGEWRRVDAEPNARVSFALPEGAVGDRGQIYVKILLNFERDFPNWRDIGVRTVDEGEDAPPMPFVADAEEGDA